MRILRSFVIACVVLFSAFVVVTHVSAPAGASVASASCGVGGVYGFLSNGQLTYTAIDPVTYKRRYTLVGSGLGLSVKAMATINGNTVLVTDTGGRLYRVDIGTNGQTEALTVDRVVQIGTGWTHLHLAYDGVSHLYGTSSAGVLLQYPLTAAKPASIGAGTQIGTGFTLKTLTALGADYLIGTDSLGELRGYKITGSSWAGTVLKSSTWQNMTDVIGAGDGQFYGHESGALYAYRDLNATNPNGINVSGYGTIDSSGWTQTILSANPTGISCL